MFYYTVLFPNLLWSSFLKLLKHYFENHKHLFISNVFLYYNTTFVWFEFVLIKLEGPKICNYATQHAEAESE